MDGENKPLGDRDRGWNAGCRLCLSVVDFDVCLSVNIDLWTIAG